MNRISPLAWQGVLAALILLGISLPVRVPSFGPPAALAQEGWKAEYEAVCSKTDVAMTLTAEELRLLIARCDQLKPQIEAQEESTRKVYLRRLQMCRDLYRYVLSSLEKRNKMGGVVKYPVPSRNYRNLHGNLAFMDFLHVVARNGNNRGLRQRQETHCRTKCIP